MLLIFTVSFPAMALEETAKVASVPNGKHLILEDGRDIRLASLQAPNMPDPPGAAKKRPGEPLGEESRDALRKLAQGQEVRLVMAKNALDRHGDYVAQVYLKDGRWLQEEMLKAGMAYVYSFPDQRVKVKPMLAAEADARKASKGIWAHSRYKPINVSEAGKRLDEYRIVQGVVRSVSERKSGIFLNFGDDWKSDFTLYIARKDARRFSKLDLPALKGKAIEVRGWIYERNGPAIDLTHPEQIVWNDNGA